MGNVKNVYFTEKNGGKKYQIFIVSRQRVTAYGLCENRRLLRFLECLVLSDLSKKILLQKMCLRATPDVRQMCLVLETGKRSRVVGENTFGQQWVTMVLQWVICSPNFWAGVSWPLMQALPSVTFINWFLYYR